MKTKSENAIFGIAFNYNDLKLFPFLKSLEQTGFTGDLVLFVNSRTCLSSVLKYRYNIVYVNVDEQFPFLGLLHKGLATLFNVVGGQYWWLSIHQKWIVRQLVRRRGFSTWQLAFASNNFYMATARFFYYWHWLIRSRYKRVFFTDVNDVVFQDDIFKAPCGDHVVAFEEYPGIRIGNDVNNKGWIEAGYGNFVLKEMFYSPIYCSGTILGSRNACLNFLSDFIHELFRNRKPLHMIGFDQGVYNYLISYEKKPYFSFSENGVVVFTLATQPELDIIVHDNVIKMKTLVHVPAVVHQYNRYNKLIDFIQEKLLSVRSGSYPTGWKVQTPH